MNQPANLIDLEPAAHRMAELVRGVSPDRLADPTPCGDYTLAALLDHVGRIAVNFTAAATKTEGPGGSESPLGVAAHLPDDWQTRIPRDLAQLAPAWRDPAAYEGMTRAGGIDLPGEVAAVVALEELVIHGWDVARAGGKTYEADDAELDVVNGFVAQIASADPEVRGDAYSLPVALAGTASYLDRVVALSGRDPNWTAR
jgi:uncharacterized protein (TIGR03086 family)